MVSSLSPDSVELALMRSSLPSSRSRIAPERSSANWATRWIDAASSLARTTANLVLSRGMTASKLGNWPDSLRVLVVGKVDLLSLSRAEQLLQLLESLARDENTLLAADAFEVLVGFFNERE